MTKLIIEIETDNEAVKSGYGLSKTLDETVRDIVEHAINRPDRAGWHDSKRSIRDGNGNTVGFWKVVYGKAVEV